MGAKAAWCSARFGLAACVALLATQANAAMVGSLGSLVTGLAGDPAPLVSITTLEARFGFDPSVGLGLNTDDGNIYYTGVVAGGAWALASSFVGGNTSSGILVNQAHGPAVRVFDFSGFSLPQNIKMSVVGSLPAAIVSQSDITVDGSISVSAGGAGGGAGGGSPSGHDGAPGGSTGGTATGGGGGEQNLGRYPSVTHPCCSSDISAAGGGGGGYIHPGAPGVGGTSDEVLVSSGSGTTATVLRSVGGSGGHGTGAIPSDLRGGTGGGGGGDNNNDQINGYAPGQSGGAGGGALLFATAGNMTVGLNGSISANGVAPGASGESNGAGGGGSGGALWFDAANAFVNYGLLSAHGGAGGINDFNLPDANHGDGFGGAGAGGMVLIDPQSIANFGTIDVSDGNGLSLGGGFVGLGAEMITNRGNIIGNAAIPEPPVGLPLLLAALIGLSWRAGRRSPVMPGP